VIHVEFIGGRSSAVEVAFGSGGLRWCTWIDVVLKR
jgi:hypothetical protein